MFAEVYKKDSSLQDEEYAECYAFEKTMLLSKNELETYSSDYEENLIKNFHQKQSSYAQSEGYHSYVSSNDSAITAPFSDSRSQTETDFVVPTDENICSQKQHFQAGSTNSFKLAADTTKWRNSFSSCCAFKNSVNYEKCNSQHIVHSARVQTPQRHHSETVLYLNEGVNKPAAKQQQQQQQQQQFSKETVQNHNPVNSQLRKLYPVSTYTVQPHAQAEAFSTCNEFANLHSSKSLASKTIFDAECRQSEQNQHYAAAAAAADYTFLDPSKKRIISNQNLKVIQKQALISYYERHHSTWRSEPQLSSNLSSVKPHPRPRLPTPTSCRLTSSSDNEESCGVNHSNACTFKNEDCNEPAPPDVSLSTNTRFFSPSPIITDTLPTIGDDCVPELPPKKAHLRIAVAARCSSSPELPLPPPPSPPPPPPSMLEEEFAPDEPFPPPPVEAVLICDMPRQFHRELTDLRDMSPSNVVVNNAATSTSRQTLPHNDSLHSTVKFDSKTPDTMCSVVANSVRLSSSSFRSYVKPTRNEARFADAVLWSDPLIEKAQTNDRYKLQHPKDEQLTHGLAKSTRNNEGNQIEQKVKAIRTLFEDKFRKSMNTKTFQFPSFSFMHSEKFPSRLDPRFPRTSYHLSQTNHQRHIRDSEKVGIYKRTASPSAIGNDESHHTAVAEADQTLSSESALSTYPEPFTEFFRYTSVTSATSVQTTVHSQTKHESDSCVLLPKFKNQNYFKSTESENNAKIFNERVAHLSQRSQSSLCDTIHKTNVASSSSASFHISRSHTSSPDECCSQKSSSSSSSSSCSSNEHSTDGKANHHLGVLSSSPSRSAFPSACHKQQIEQNESLVDLSRSVMCARSATIDAASQTEVDVIFEEKPSLANVCGEVDCASSSFSHHSVLPINEVEEEIEQLRREVISYLAPTNRLYKILEPKSETKTSIDYLHNVFQTQILQMKLFPKKFSSVSESEDTRLQEGSIKCRDGDELEVSHQTVQNEACDNFQILPCSVACPLQQKKRNLNTHLIQKLNKLKIEQNAVHRECLSNEELGNTISEKVLRFVTPREASKYKSYVQEIGQITSLLLGLGERLAKVENSLFDMPLDSCRNEKDILQNKRDQLLRQLEDAKELKKNIDKRGYSLSSSLQKYLSEPELEDYQRFIQTKCRLLIHSRSINDKIFHLQRLVNALKEDEIESHTNSLLQFIN